MVLRCNFLLELWNMHGNLHCIWIWIVNGQSSRHPHINVHKWQRKVENMKNTFIEKDMRIYFVLTYFVCRVETQTLCRLTSNETKLFDKSNEWIALQQEKNIRNVDRVQLLAIINRKLENCICDLDTRLKSVICLSSDGTCMTNPCLCCMYEYVCYEHLQWKKQREYGVFSWMTFLYFKVEWRSHKIEHGYPHAIPFMLRF